MASYISKFKLLITLIVLLASTVVSNSDEIDSTSLVCLKTIDPGLLPYFPRWSLCEPNLQLQVWQVFNLNGSNPKNLDKANIRITASPLNPEEGFYNIMLIECGSEKMTSDIIDSKMRLLNEKLSTVQRNYCYKDIPIASPPSQAQIEAITNYLEMPTNTTHSFSLSAFEQTLKFGKEDGYWVRSIIGTEGAGYPFVSSGEAKVVVQHPLYVNEDEATKNYIPNLLNFHVGMGYRFKDTSNGIASFIPTRTLNAAYGGKGVFGFDFHAPFEPNFGISFHAEVPMQRVDTAKSIEAATYATYYKENPLSPRDRLTIAPLLRITGNAGVFYNWWLEPGKYENYVRFDLGVNYTEVQEASVVKNENGYFLNDRVKGTNLFHPTEFMDWIYAKVEYRNQSTFPFGLSAQFSNQIFLSRVYLPLIGSWLYLDARYSIPLRSENRVFDKSIFMISPVLRLNI
jgi:hypothetical protein